MKRIAIARIRAVWLDPHLTTAEAAARVGLTRVNLWLRAKALGLPARKGGRRPRVHADRTAEFTRMWMRGDRIADIAAHFGISIPSVTYRCRSLGLPGRGHRHHHFAVGREDEFAAMWAAGIATGAIAGHFGVFPRTVTERARLTGLPSRPRRKVGLPIEAWHEMQLADRMAEAARREQSAARQRGLRDTVRVAA